MKTTLKTLAIAIGVVALLACTMAAETKVYICTGKYAKKYHYDEDCRGLSNCKGDVKEVELKEAKKYRTLCGFED